MSASAPLPRAVAVVGPTAAGKSGVAMHLAEALELPILCCDSVQVYRGLDIGSAKPSARERARVRHELLDVVDPDQDFTAGDYARLAHERLREGPAIVCGGTGFYLRAATWSQAAASDEGALPRSHPRRASFEAEWAAREELAAGSTHRALAAIDPVTARAIHPNNVVRALRALWLCELAGAPVSAARERAEKSKHLELLMIVIDPGVEAVDRAIDLRCERMFAEGWLEEVDRLLAAGFDPRYKSLRSLGYRQLADYLRPPSAPAGSDAPRVARPSLAELQAKVKASTRHYARRQRTFFRHQFKALPPHRILNVVDPVDLPTERVEHFLRGNPT